MPRYARGSGLLHIENDGLTTLGRYVFEKDIDLSYIGTQWLMHYHLSAPHGPGPLFWHLLVTRFLRPGDRVNSRTVARWIAEGLSQAGQQVPDERALQSTATIFLGTYARSEGLEALGILRQLDNDRRKDASSYEVCVAESPTRWAFAYALADYWEHHYPNQVTIPLSELSQPGGLRSVFWLEQGALMRLLQTLKSEGVLDVYRVAPPYQVVKHWDGKELFLERIYDRSRPEND